MPAVSPKASTKQLSTDGVREVVVADPPLAPLLPVALSNQEDVTLPENSSRPTSQEPTSADTVMVLAAELPAMVDHTCIRRDVAESCCLSFCHVLPWESVIEGVSEVPPRKTTQISRFPATTLLVYARVPPFVETDASATAWTSENATLGGDRGAVRERRPDCVVVGPKHTELRLRQSAGLQKNPERRGQQG